MRFLATFVTAIVLTSSFSVPASSTVGTTELTADERALAVVFYTAPPPAGQHRLDLPRADRSGRVAGAATAAVTKPEPKRVVKPAVKKAPAVVKPAVKPAVKKAPSVTAVPAANGSRVDQVVGFALAQVGKPYKWGAAGPGAYDCSGLTMAAYARVGIRLPHQSGGQAGAGRAVSRGTLQRGDLIVYSGHVAIALGGGKMVHAANPSTGIVVANIYGSPTGYRRLL